MLVAVPVLYIVVFKYIPMYGAQIAFREYNPIDGMSGSPWVGLKQFRLFIESYQFGRVLTNTLGLGFYKLLADIPMPIILALALNNIMSRRYRKFVQMVTYAPYFISTVVMVSLVMQVLHPTFGVVNSVLRALGFDNVNFMGQPQLFKSIYVWSGVWQQTGLHAVIYIAALASIDPSLHEAAIVDGASKLQRIRHIEIPGILPTATILLILNMGRVMNVEFEKVFLMQNQLNLRTSDVIATYIYRVGLISAQHSFGTAVGLFNSIINLALLVSVNQVAKKVGETSLW